MTDQPGTPSSPHDCMVPTELRAFTPDDLTIAGRWVERAAKLPPAQRPTEAVRTAAGDTRGDELLDEIGLSNLPVGAKVVFNFWEPGVYHMMIPTGELIDEGRRWAECLQTVADLPAPGPGRQFPLTQEYEDWCNNAIEPLDFFHYRLGDYTFGHCGG